MDSVLSIHNSFTAVRQGVDRFPEHNGVIPRRPCSLFRGPGTFLSFPRLSHVLLPRQRRRNLLFLLVLLFLSFFLASPCSSNSFFFSSLFSSLIFLAVLPDALSDLRFCSYYGTLYKFHYINIRTIKYRINTSYFAFNCEIIIFDNVEYDSHASQARRFRHYLV